MYQPKHPALKWLLVISVFLLGGAAYADTTPPTVDLRVSDGKVVWGEIRIFVDASDDVEMGHVEFYVDDNLIGEDNNFPYFKYWDTETVEDGNHAIMAIAFDAAGNQNSDTITVTVYNSPDTTSPTVSIISPVDGATVSGDITIEVDADDDRKMDRVEFYIDGMLKRVDDAVLYECDWDTESVADGSHEITVIAFDDAENQNTVSITVTTENGIAPDTTPPTVSIVRPFDGETVSGEINIQAEARDNWAIDRVEIYVDGDLRAYDTELFYIYDWDTEPEVNGSHTILAIAFDESGNQSSDSVTVTVDNAAVTLPTAWISSPVDGEIVSGTVTIEASTSNWRDFDRVEIYVDGDLRDNDTFKPFNYNWDTEAEANGDHVINIIGFDNNGNQSTDSITVTVDNGGGDDTTPPTVSIIAPINGATVSGTTTISASASDAGGIERVEFFVDGALKSTDDTSPYSYSWDTASVADGSHTVMVTAFDNAGNENSDSVTVTVENEATGDTNPPMVYIASPDDGETVSGEIKIWVNAGDGSGIERVDFYIDGSLRTSDTKSPYVYDWDTVPFVDSNVVITVRAYDNAGNENSDSITVTVSNGGTGDTTPPTVTITAPTDGATVSGTTTIAVNASDAGGIERVEFFVDGALKSTDDTSPYSYSWDTGSVADGGHTIMVTAVDNAGNENSDSVIVTVSNGATGDITPPTVTINAPTDGATVSGTTTIAVDASDAGGIDRVEFYVDGDLKSTDTTSLYSYSWDTQSVADGGHTIMVWAFDNAGNENSASLGVTVNNISTYPVVSITSPAVNSTFNIGASVTILATASDPDGLVTKVEFYNGGTYLGEDASSPYAYTWTNLTVGSFLLIAKAFDDSGNVTASVPVSIVVLETSDPSVGFTPGSFAVNDMGAAGYTIPIAVPPGTAGMTPEIAIGFNSQSGNGLLGEGWALSGNSYITRCGRTIAQDGAVGGVNMDTNDRLMLDGQRLINHTGAYWGVGTEYRTEVETYTKVVEENGYFKVYTKSGEIKYYGKSTAERMDNSSTGGTMIWALSHIYDRFGNYIRFTYTKESGRILPYRIEYTMNDGQGYSLPYAYVQYIYEGRTDITTGYVKGHLTSLAKRLKEIQVFNEGSLVRKYVLEYDADPSIGRSKLASVREQDEYGNALPNTAFSYSAGGGGLTAAPQFALPACDAGSGGRDYFILNSYIEIGDTFKEFTSHDLGVRLVDLNGDGLMDRVQYFAEFQDGVPAGTSASAWLNNGSGWVYHELYKPPVAISSIDWKDRHGWDGGVRFVDLNSDGLVDMVRGLYNYGTSYRNAWLNTGNGWAASTDYTPPVVISGRDSGTTTGWDYGIRFADLNGDGRVDMIRGWYNYGTSYRNAWLNTGSGWAASSVYTPPVYISGHDSAGGGWDAGVRLVDLNSDGLVDMVRGWYNYGTTYRNAWLNTGSGWASSTQYIPPVAISGRDSGTPLGWDYGVRLPDLNGDGLPDMVRGWYNYGTTYRNAWLNTGNAWAVSTGYTPPVVISGRDSSAPRGWDYGVRLVDLNRDGLVDMVRGWYNYGTTYKNAWLNKGTGWVSSSSYVPPVAITGRDGRAPGGWDYGFCVGDFNGDGFPDFTQAHCYGELFGEWDGSSTQNYYDLKNAWLNSGAKPNLININNGAEKNINIAYKPLTDSSVYTKGSGATYPEMNLKFPLSVVSSCSFSDGIGGTNSLEYKYRDLRTHLQGRGLLGFESVETYDNAIGSSIKKHFRQDFPYVQLLSSQDEYQNKSGTPQLLSHVESQYNQVVSGGIYRVRTSRIYKYDKEYNDLAVIKKSSTDYNTYDAYDNATQMTVNIENDTGSQHFRTVTNSTYTNYANNWILGRLTATTVTHSQPDDTYVPDIVRYSSFGYNPTTGALERETTEPNTDYELTTAYEYDPFGNKETATVSGYDIDTRVTQIDYDSRGRFPLRTTNELGHVVEMEFDGRFGLVKKVIVDPDGVRLITEHQYDSSARLIRTDHPDGTYSVASYNWASSPTYAVYKKTTQSPNLTSLVTEYYDSLDRVIRTKTIDRFGKTVLANVAFNTYGRVTDRSEPFFEGQSPHWTCIYYDAVNRPYHFSLPDGSVADVAYDGLVTTRTENGLISTTKEADAKGNLIRVVNDLDDATRYEYDAVGNLTVLIDAQDNRVENFYDDMGHKTSMNDPDMGHLDYYYNALGQMWKQVDARGSETQLEYDLMGRMKKRIEPEGESEWIYDTRFVGQLSTVTSPGGYTKEIYYDGLGRITSAEERIDGVWYTVQTDYDAYGRAREVTYPDCGNGAVKVSNVYSANGYANELRDDVTGFPYWQAVDADASGRLKEEELGNGITTTREYDEIGRTKHITSGSVQDLDYEYDDFGNLEYRTDLHDGITEGFTYDHLHRLKTWTKGGTTVSYFYDAIGNITYKSNVGAYEYGSSRPHAVTLAGGYMYDYDANGNMTVNRTGGAVKTLLYASFNKPYRIEYGDDECTIQYGSGHERIVKRTPEKITTYIGGMYEKVAENDKITHRYYIGGGMCVLEKSTLVSGQTLTWLADVKKYVLKDHLGSTHTVTDESGTIIEKNIFAPFGEKTPLVAGDLTLGFTGHEHDDEFGLINMKARMYDPVLGRFLSADPYVQIPSNGQSLNRYSYCLNNPLVYTDPSGNDFWSDAWDFCVDVTEVWTGYTIVEKLWDNPYVQMAVTIAVMVYAPYLLPAMNPVLLGAISGGLSAAISSGGDLNAILTGAASGAAFGAIGGEAFGTVGEITAERVVAHAAVSGIRSELQGGKFIQGAITGAITKMTAGEIDGYFKDNILGGAVASGIVGGTVSTMSGGKFGNGFYTAAMAYTFNQKGRSWNAKRLRQERVAAQEQMQERAKFRADVWAMEHDYDMDQVAYQLYTCNADGPTAFGLENFMTEANWFAAYVHDIDYGATTDWRNYDNFTAANLRLITNSGWYANTYGGDLSKSISWGSRMTWATNSIIGHRSWVSEHERTISEFPDSGLR